VLTAIHGADDGAIDGAHVAAASVGIVAARSSTCRQPAEHPCGPQMGGRAMLPRHFRSSARLRCGFANQSHAPLPAAPRQRPHSDNASSGFPG
jgi:hypothetical protein